jgi:hypothetical protein
VKEFSNLSSFNLIPNPATNIVVVNGSMKNSNQIAITVTDLLGKTLIKEHAYSNIKQFNHKLNIADLASGVYMVRIASNNEYKTLRLVKE